MAKRLDKQDIVSLNIVRPYHVSQSVDAFTGIVAYDINVSGSFQVTGSTILSGSTYIKTLTTASQTNLLTINPATGQLFYTASSAVGGADTNIGNSNLSVPSSTTRTLSIPNGSVVVFNGSFAQGVGNSAGTNAHAEGFGTQATGDYSHAEGAYTTAIGVASHAEGAGTIASGSYSHAEGRQTIASGIQSHAEGFQTTSSGTWSHAEGSYTSANGAYSHAEGDNTTTHGDGSHAEGYLTIASGSYSHAEGFQTTASGDSSHASGYQTVARGNYSYAGGQNTIASGSYQTVVGSFNTHGNTTSRFIVGGGSSNSDRKDALIVTSNNDVGINISNPTSKLHVYGGEENAYMIYNTSSAAGDLLLVSGNRNLTRIGITTPTGSNNFAQLLMGVRSSNSDSSYDWYGKKDDTFIQSTALTNGLNIINYSLATGNIKENYIRFYAGHRTETSLNDQPHLHIHGTGSNRGYVGVGTIDPQANLHISGSLLNGKLVTATGLFSHAEGLNTTTIGNNSHAEGESTITRGVSSHAEGGATLTLGNFSHAEGFQTTASGDSSHASGYQTTAVGSYSYAGGANTIASGSSQTVVGLFNTHGDITSRFIVGGGTNAGSRVDAFKVTDRNTIVVATQSAAPSYTGVEGEMVPVVNGGNYYIYVYIGGAWHSSSLA